MKIHLIRHGESEGNVDKKVYNKTPDRKVKLTKKGFKQAEDLGRSFKGKAFSSDLFFSSTHDRALDTANTFIKAAGLQEAVDLINEPRICEQAFFSRLGRKFDVSQMKKRREFGSFHFKFDNGGESGLDVYTRVAPFLQNLITQVRQEEVENVFLFSHGITINIMLMYIMNMQPAEFEDLEYIKNCEVLIIDENMELITPVRKRSDKADIDTLRTSIS